VNEKEIINEIIQGNRNLFKLLVEKYQSMVFRTCMGFLHQKDDADDLTQEIFVQAYQSLNSFRGNAAFSTWIYRIAVNASLNKIRKTSTKKIFQQFEGLFTNEKKNATFLSDIENPEVIIIKDQHREWVQKALNKLPEKQRTAIVLSKYDDLTQKEIAEIMHTTEGAVEALIQRAKSNLRKNLSSYYKNKK